LEYETDDAPGGRTERHAEPDLRLSRADGVRDKAIKTDGREEQREPTEECREERGEPLLRHRRIDELIECPEGECDPRIGLRQRLRDPALEGAARTRRRLDRQRDGRPELGRRRLRDWHV